MRRHLTELGRCGSSAAADGEAAGAGHRLRRRAWWPYSRDFPAELPALLAELNGRLGGVERVSYNLDDWGLTARRISVDGALVRLAGYRSQHPDTVDLIGPRTRLTLLVIPPQASPRVANRALRRAGQPGDTTSIEELLTASSAAGSSAQGPAGLRVSPSNAGNLTAVV
jgi:hypothetical protein